MKTHRTLLPSGAARLPLAPGPESRLAMLLPAVFLSVVFLVGPVAPAAAEVWTEVPLPPGASSLTALHSSEQWLYAAADSGGVGLGLYRTPVGSPGTWAPLGLNGQHIRDILSCGPADRDLFVTASGYYSIRRSQDHGLTWSITLYNTGEAKSLAWDGGVPGRVWVTVDIPDAEGRVCRTTNRGDTWTSEDVGFANQGWWRTLLSAAGDSSGSVYHSSKLYAMAGYEMHWSPTGAAPWTYLGSLTDMYTRDLETSAADPSLVYLLNGDAYTYVRRWDGGSYLEGDWYCPIVPAEIESPPWAAD